MDVLVTYNVALVLSFIYGIGDALIKSLGKDLRNAMECGP
jgi:hypothetical protein